jgi:HEAT repeat protein
MTHAAPPKSCISVKALGTATHCIPALTAALEGDPDCGVRASAAAALGAIGPAAKAALPALRAALGDRNAKLTHNAALSELRVRAQMAINEIQGEH